MTPRRAASGQEIAERVIARARRTPVDLARLPPQGVPGALFSGAAGVAFFLYEAGRLKKDDGLVERARLWARAGRKWAERASERDWRGGRNGFLIGAPGLDFVDALLGAHTGDARALGRALERLASAASAEWRGPRGMRRGELFGGAAGFVGAARHLAARLAPADAAQRWLVELEDRAIRVLERGHARPLRANARLPLGMAHGVGGELWALALALGAEHPLVRARLSELARLREIDTNGLVYWPKTVGSSDLSMVGSFCNGLAGQLLLWSLLGAASARARPRAFAAAVAESLAVVKTPSASLCCGLAGQAVAFDCFADMTRETRFRRLASVRLARALNAVEQALARALPLGLFQGVLGVVLVAITRDAGERSFPCIEPPRRG